MGVNETDSFILLNPPSTWKTARTQAGLVAAMDKTLRRELPDALYSWSQPVQMRMDDLLSGVRTQIAVSIFGGDLTTLTTLGNKVVAAISSVKVPQMWQRRVMAVCHWLWWTLIAHRWPAATWQ